MLEARFCPQCGTAMEPQLLGDRVRPVCPACHFVYYVNPIVAAGTLVEEGGRVLLIRRGVEPGLGQWGLPAGYGEVDETPEETARRETQEEAGVEVALDGLLGVYPFSAARPSGVLILYAAHITGGEPLAGDDALEVRFFPPDGLPTEIAFVTHRQAVTEWARTRAITYQPADAEQIEAAARLAAEDEEAHAHPQLAQVRGGGQMVIVALDGAEVVGFVALEPDPAERLVHLHAVYVRPSYRRWGIGTRLLQQARESARERGARLLRAEVPTDSPALFLLLRAGFTVCGFVQQGQASILFLCQEF